VKIGDLVVWRTRQSTKSTYRGRDALPLFAIVVEMPMSYLAKGVTAKIMTFDGKMFTVPLGSHYVLEVISETR